MHPVYSPNEQVDNLLFDISHYLIQSIDTPEHSHSCVEITLIVNGRVEHTINGKKEYAYPGCLYIFYQNSTHCLQNAQACELYNISCCPDFMQILGSELSCLQNFQRLFGGNESAIGMNIGGLLFHDMKTLIEKMYAVFLDRERQDRLVTLRSMFSIFLILMTQAELPHKFQDKDHSLYEVVRFMEKHYSEPISLDQLARLSCLSKNHFLRKFRAKFGTSPMRYWAELRLSEARKILLTTDCTVNEAAIQTGFYSGSHLSREFSKKYKTSITITKKQQKT